MRAALRYHCAACGKPLLRAKRTGRIPRYCLENGACRKKAYRRRVKYKQLARAQQNRLGHLSAESFEWYTPQTHVKALRRVMGEIELDPASSDEANRVIQAQRYYTIVTDGLSKTWNAKTLFLNPPYCKTGNTSNQDVWTAKLLREYREGHVKEAILLVTTATETAWFQRLFQFPLCFVKGRLDFTTPHGKSGGATKGSVFVYLGKRPEVFEKVFRRYGAVISPRG